MSIYAILTSLDQLHDFESQELSSALTFIMCLLPEHVLELIWLLKVGVDGTSWLQGPVWGREDSFSIPSHHSPT